MSQLIERYDDRKSDLREYAPAILVFVFVFGMLMYSMLKKGVGPKPLYLSAQFDEKVLDIFKERSDVYLSMTSQDWRFRFKDSYNYDYETPMLSEFLEIGDRVIKNKCSDTLYVLRGGEEFHFLLEDRNYNSPYKVMEERNKWNKRRPIVTEYNDCD